MLGVIFIVSVSIYSSTIIKFTRDRMISETRNIELTQNLGTNNNKLFILIVSFTLTENENDLESYKSKLAETIYSVQNSLDILTEKGTFDPDTLESVRSQTGELMMLAQDIIHFHDLSISQALSGTERAVVQIQEEDQLQEMRKIQDEISSLISNIIDTANKNFEQSIKNINKVEKTTFLVFVLAILAVIIFAFIFSDFITRPIRRLTKAATEISKGKLKQKVVIQSNDEIGNLARAFNTMSQKLKQYYQDLGKEVRQRTADLEKSKHILESKINDLERFQKVTIGRELRMIELKNKIKELQGKN